jgi:chromosome segregation ATPase
MEEFKDRCQDLEVRGEELAADLRQLPMDYKLAERYTEIDQEIYEMMEWYERMKREKREMEERLRRVEWAMKLLNNDIQDYKLYQFSREQKIASPYT